MKDNIIKFLNYGNNKNNPLRFALKETVVQNKYHRNKLSQKHAVIVLKNTKNGRIAVHELTSFVYEIWGRKEFNTQKANATRLIAFLNHIVFEFGEVYGLKTLKDLETRHALFFLEYKIKQGCSKQTIDAYDILLTRFYYYMTVKGILSKFKKEDFIFKEDKRFSQTYLDAMFGKYLSMNPKRNNTENKAKKLIDQHIVPFLQVATIVCPDIVLAIYMCMNGGLRASEVLSIRKSSIDFSIQTGLDGNIVITGMAVLVKTDIQNAKGNNNHVKRPRKQYIFSSNNLLNMFYKRHMEKFDDPNVDALFTNRNGEVMQYHSYRSRFNKVKKAFIKTLRDSDNPDDNMAAISYGSTYWSTHICRGIFTNELIKKNYSAVEVMLARGDSSKASAVDYIILSEKEQKNNSNSIEDLYEKRGGK